jgi:hypothetical protein
MGRAVVAHAYIHQQDETAYSERHGVFKAPASSAFQFSLIKVQLLATDYAK